MPAAKEPKIEKIVEAISLLISYAEQNGISTQEILNSNKKSEMLIPASIFSKLPALEAISKFLIEEKNMSLKECAEKLGRSQKTIWGAYRRAKKVKGDIDLSSKVLIPLSVFSQRKRSLMENAVSYLKKEGMSIIEIAKEMRKSYQNIWTIAKRAEKKGKLI
ncbi:MAG: hypothetical protein QW439_02885 [Candidatus Woesearchaeota archaeon]